MLVKTAVASLCHTDFLVIEGVFNTKLPCTGSHEGSGTVVAVGGEVKDFKEGDRVMNGLGFHRCGTCDNCTSENYQQYCESNEGSVGVRMDGNFAEYVRVDARNCAVLPEEVSFETAAPLACAGCTVFRALRQTELNSGQTVGIVGCGGGLGHLAIQFGKAMGLKVIGIDARDEGLALAKEHNPDLLLDARKGDAHLVEEIKKFTGKGGVDAAINLADAPQAAGTACAISKQHGLLVQISQVIFHVLVSLGSRLILRTAGTRNNSIQGAHLPRHPHKGLSSLQYPRSKGHAEGCGREGSHGEGELVSRA